MVGALCFGVGLSLLVAGAVGAQTKRRRLRLDSAPSTAPAPSTTASPVRTTVRASAPKITLVEASLGHLCNWGNKGKLTRDVDALCQGKVECAYKVPTREQIHARYGFWTLARGGCTQAFEAKYHCGNGVVREAWVPGDAWGHPAAQLTCARAAPARPSWVPSSYPASENVTIHAAFTCNADSDCDDGRFCNGAERCQSSSASRDARGCVRSAPPCGKGVSCDETASRCAPTCPDADGDGHRASHCGGTDCDDRDPQRYPGNIEVCDARGHDEDCDPRTFAGTDGDRDGDGAVSAACYNMHGDQRIGGDDCDDSKKSIKPGSTRCGSDPRIIQMCEQGTWTSSYCPGGGSGRCAPRPDGSGICTQ